MDLDELTARQRMSLWLEGREGLRTQKEAARFMAEVGIALRYGANPSLPVASMFRATQRHGPPPEDQGVAHKRAFALTNQMLGEGQAIEINLVADRLALAHPSVMPAIHTLRLGAGGPGRPVE